MTLTTYNIPKIKLEGLLWSSLILRERGCWRLVFTPLGNNSLYEKIHVTPKYKRLREGEPGVICVALGQNISRILITIHMHKLDHFLCLGFHSAMVVKNTRTALKFTIRHGSWIDNREVITKHEWSICTIDHLERDVKIAYGITNVNNMVSTNSIGGVFTTIGGSIYKILWFWVPLYKGIVQNVDISSLGSPRSQVCHEVRMNKTGDQNWFSHRREKLVRKFFRIFSILFSLIPFNSLKVIVVRCFCIELDGGWGIFIEVAI